MSGITVGKSGTPGTGTGSTSGIITGLTGGANNSLVYQVDATTCAPAHPSFLTELDTKNLYWKDYLGQYWVPGSVVTDAAGSNLNVGYVRALQGQASTAAANFRDIDPTAGQPSDLAPTVNQDYVEFGRPINSTQWRFKEPQVDGLTTTPSIRFDGLLVANYPRSAQAPTGRFRTDRFGTFEDTNPTFVYTTGSDANFFLNGAGLLFQPASSGAVAKRRFGTDEITGQFADGQIRYAMFTGGATNEYGLHMRTTGTAGAENTLLFLVDEQAGTVKIVTVVGNTAYTVLASTSLAVTHGTKYHWRAEAFGTWAALKIWLVGGTEPAAWTVSTFQSTINGSGWSGVYSNYPIITVGHLGTVINRGAQAALTGAT